MKNLQKLRWIFVLFLALLAAQACNKDDPAEQIVPDKAVEADTTKDGADGTNTKDGTDGTNGTDTTNGTDNGNTNDGITSEKVSEEGQITLYKVNGVNLTKETDFTVTGSSLEYQKDTAKHQEVWGLVKKVFPQKYLDKLTHFVLFSAEVEGNGTAGFVLQTSDDQSDWKLGIAMDVAYQDGFNTDGELGYVLVHELAHIITGDETQIDSSITESSCKNYYPGSGCAKKDSYQNIFFDKFWADIWSEFSPLNVSASEEEAFYQKHKDRFVSAYAASNPVEDIAETFAAFVTEDGITETGISKQKVELMFTYPEFVEMRNFIRGNTTFD